jgi:lipopolysaccharide/colanic/teichoic acid biosynthesis glycosyltransferase
MKDKSWQPSDSLTVGAAAAIGAGASYLAFLSGQFQALGVRGWLGYGAVAVVIAAVVLAHRLLLRRRALGVLLRLSVRPLCTVKSMDLGILPSSLARPLLADGSAPYVERDTDPVLAMRLQTERIVFVVGPSGAGKTASVFNTVRNVFGGTLILAPREPGDDSDRHPGPTLRTVLELTMRLPWRRTDFILWLDDLGRFLDQGAIDAALLNQWLAASPGRRVVATLTSADQARHEDAQGSACRTIRTLLRSASVLAMALDWTPAERLRARSAYAGLSEDAFARFARYLAYAPLVLYRLRRAQEDSSAGALVLKAMADCQSIGIAPVSPQLLLDLLPLYNGGRPSRALVETWLSEGLAWIVTPEAGGLALGFQSSDEPTYCLATSIADLVREEAGPPPGGFWETLLHHRVAPWERVALARAALLYGADDVARAATGALNRDRSADPEAQRAAGFLMLELTARQQPQVSGLLERASAGAPGITPTPNTSWGVPLGDLLPPRHRLLARINNSPLAKTAVRLLTLLAADVTGLWASLVAAYWILDGAGWEDARRAADERIGFVAVVAVLLFGIGHLYRPRIRRANFARLLAALTQLGGMFVVLRVMAGGAIGSYSLIVLALALAFPMLGVARLIHLRCAQGLYEMALGRTPHRAIIGGRDEVEQVMRLGSESDLHRLVGWVSCDGTGGKVDGLDYLGPVEDLAGLIDRFQLDDLVLCSEDLDAASTTSIADAAWTGHADLRAISPRRNFLVSGSRYVPGEQLPLDELRVPVLDQTQRVVKRSFDIVVSSLGLIASAPVWLLIALAIRTGSEGRALTSVPRAGIGTRPFAMWRFRTCYVSAEGVENVAYTRLGRWLRLVGLDELPQLINVLKGEMSLVGPRPVAQQHFEQLDDWQLRRYLVAPGLTGLWQISGRQDRDYADMVKLDFYYVQRWSLFKDIEILLKSVPVSFRGGRATVITETDNDSKATATVVGAPLAES